MSAPSFSSFPPSFSSFPDSEPGPSNSHGSPRKERERDRKEKRREKSKRDNSRHKSRTLDNDIIHDQRSRFKDDIRENFSTPNLFYSDTKGDPLNIKYGGLHAGDVPKYSVVARGRKVLGLNNAWTVVHRSRGGLEIAVGGKRKLPSISDASTRHMLKAAPTRTLVNSAQDIYQYREIDGFLRLPTHRPHTINDSYRDIDPTTHEHSDESQSSAEDEQGSGSDDDSEEPTLSSLQRTLKSLEEQLREDPCSIQTWLNLLFHTLSTIANDTKNASKMKSEITLSILSRAIEAHLNNKHSKVLWLRYLRAGEEIWTESKLQEEWEDALKMDDVDIWIEWLDWKVRRAHSMDDVLSGAERVLSSFRRSGDEIGSVRAFWRIAVAFRDAGFTERATALFQAQAELTFHKPAKLAGLPFISQLESLEAYWESEVPRVGDVGAVGWATWENTGHPETEHVPRIHSSSASDLQDPYARWANGELVADQSQLLPGRSYIDDEDGDPYATILFSDIQPFLLDLTARHTKETFRLAWLSAIGLHIPGFAASLSEVSIDNRDDRWCSTAFSSSRFLSALFPKDLSAKLLTADAQAGVLVGREREYNSPFGPIKQWGLGALRPLDRIGNLTWGLWTNEDVFGVDETLVRAVFTQCRLPGQDVDWNTLQLAFEAAVNLKSATKVSKSFLSVSQNSLLCWAAHARLERLRGRLDDARKVYNTVLTSAHPNSPGYYALWWDWAELEWLSGTSEATLKVIFRCASSGTGSLAILRAKRHLEDTWNSLSTIHWKEREACLRLRGLLELLTTSSVAVLSVFDSHLETLDPGTIPHESMVVASLCMLYVHGSVLRNPFPPVLLRGRVEKAIETYPSNTVLLGLFLDAERGQSVWGRVRLLLGEQPLNGLLHPKDVARRVAEVWAAGWEKGAWKAEEERTRSGLAAALQDDRTRYSPILWRIYLEFEIRAGELQRAKKLLFRAVKECPLVKELYLLAFGALRSVFSPRELSEWAETMAERGIRMRRGLDEALEGWTDKTPERHVTQDDENEDDEIEYNARELRRLRPY